MYNWHFIIRDMSKHELVTLVEKIMKEMKLSDEEALAKVQEQSRVRDY